MLLHIFRGPACSAPQYYASQWEHHRKVSVTRLWHLQREASSTLSFCFSTYPDTALCQGHMPTVQDLQCRITRNTEWREMVVGHQRDKLVSSAPWEELLCVMSYLKSLPSAASLGLCHISFQQSTLTGQILWAPAVCKHISGNTAFWMCWVKYFLETHRGWYYISLTYPGDVMLLLVSGVEVLWVFLRENQN